MKIIEKRVIQLSQNEIAKEVIVEKRFLFWKYKETYREVYGEIFRYKRNKYLLCNNSSIISEFRGVFLQV